jgi:hypothetical protein
LHTHLIALQEQLQAKNMDAIQTCESLQPHIGAACLEQYQGVLDAVQKLDFLTALQRCDELTQRLAELN